MSEALALFASAFVTLFVVIDPPGCAPIFTSLTGGASRGHQKSMAARASLIAFLVLLGFALAGRPFLAALGISLAAFRIAGGIMVFLIAIDMVFEKRSERREHRAEAVKAANAPEDDISVFPMAIPMLAGPGSIAAIMLLTASARGALETGVVLTALAAVMAISYVTLRVAGPLMRLLGPQFEVALTRLLGVILAALAAQFVIDGVKESFGI